MMCEPTGLLQLACDRSARLCCVLCRLRTLLHAFVVCDVVRALPTRGPMQRVVACTVTMCNDVNVYYLDQWRSSDSSTDVNIMIHNFREGHMTLLTHALHRAPSVSLETWSGELQYLFDRAVTRRCWTQHATTIVNNDIAREDAARFRHETAARWCARC